MSTLETQPARASGEFAIGGELPVVRLGYGSMQIPGPGVAAPGGPLQRIAVEHAATPPQLALAWLLQRSPVLLPIPGTSTVAHLEENVAAALIELTADQIRQLDTAI